MSENPLLTAALAYAARGWAVFPCQPRGKAPATAHGVHDASCDPAQIRRWWGVMPQANIGLACGPAGLVVLDLDGGDGLQSWEELRLAYGFADDTVCSATGNGLHFLFAAPPDAQIGNSAGKLGPGLDVRARGGYIIAPPSVHPTGHVYAWDDAHHPDHIAPLPLPEVLCAMLVGDSPRRHQEDLEHEDTKRREEHEARMTRRVRRPLRGLRASRPSRTFAPSCSKPFVSSCLGGEKELAAVRAAPEGARNDTLNRAAFLLGKDVAAGRLDRAATEAALLDAAQAAGLPAREARATIASGLRASLGDSPRRHEGHEDHEEDSEEDMERSARPKSSSCRFVSSLLRGETAPAAWLDAYIAFSRAWSPRAPNSFHEACGLWLLSTIAARRVVTHIGGARHTNLYIALTARSSIYGKSTTARIALDTLRAAGLEHLLAPDDATPQAFIAALAARLPDDYASLGDTAQARARARLAWAGQRGWHYEEFGSKVAALMRENGFMADFRGLLRKLDDCPPAYEYVTVGRGATRIERPYLALLASLTPADLRPFARRGAALWQDGFWARFAFAAPSAAEPPGEGRFPEGERVIPAALVEPLAAWHRRLGQAEAEITPRAGGGQDVTLHPAPEQACALAPEVCAAFYLYNETLLRQALEAGNEDLDGPYARLAEKALRVALLLCSVEGGATVEARHWARGEAVAERWRAGLHAVYEQVNTAAGDERTRDLEERLLELVDKRGNVTAGVARSYIKNLSAEEALRVLGALAEAGVLGATTTQRGTLRFQRVVNAEE